MTMRVHLSLGVEDLSGASAFYRTLFGHQPTKSHQDYVNFRLDQPPIHLALQQASRAQPATTARHFGIELPDHEHLQQWRDRLTAAGVEFRDQARAECCYAKGDKLWVSDPDRHVWEIWVRTGESDRLADRDAACCA